MPNVFRTRNWPRKLTITASCILASMALSCSRRTPAAEFGKLAEEVVYKSLSFSPVAASAQGLHKYKGEDFDRDLDNLNFRAIQRQRNYYVDLHKRLEGFD